MLLAQKSLQRASARQHSLWLRRCYASDAGGKDDDAKVIRIDRSGLFGAGPTSGSVKVEKEPETPMSRHLKTLIKFRGGPITMHEYMSEVLTNPRHGYYVTRDVFGRKGDFTTSPEISQIFGEMIGVWCVAMWARLGSPERMALVEMGPGRGTLMADLLRGTLAFPAFSKALEVHLVEVSPVLSNVQHAALRCGQTPGSAGNQQDAALGEGPIHGRGVDGRSTSDASSTRPMPPFPSSPSTSAFGDVSIRWHRSIDSVPSGTPTLYIAHELLDALPVHQFQKTSRGWCERLVDVASEDSPLQLRLVLSPGATPASRMILPRRLRGLRRREGADEGQRSGREGADEGQRSGREDGETASREACSKASQKVLNSSSPPSPRESVSLDAMEIAPHAMVLAADLARRIASSAGAALLIDYGQDGPYPESLAAIRGHKFVGLLEQPGSADLSAHVDFDALRQAVEELGREAEKDDASPGQAAADSSSRAAATRCFGPLTQAAFLQRLGVEHRVQRLLDGATQAQAKDLVEGYARLVGRWEGARFWPSEMGRNYKVMCLASPMGEEPVAFEGEGRGGLPRDGI